MIKNNIDFKGKSVLILGVGGVSMHQIALFLKQSGFTVFGYDVKTSEYTKLCEDAGIKISRKFKQEFLQVDFCVKSSAITSGKFLSELKKQGTKIYDRAEILGFIANKFKNVIAVAGTHGKSTTASLIYEILRLDNRKVSCHIGADVFAARFDVKDEILVLEACEYNKSFLNFHPTISVVTNVEADHIESYGSLFNLKNAFAVFLKRGKVRFINRNESTNYLHNIKDVKVVDRTNLNIKPKILGEHNYQNISMAVAVCKSIGVSEKVITQAINSFAGVPRRYEFLGMWQNNKIYIDYAHHPTEINAFYETFKQENKNCAIVFQPHTYSRTKYLLNQFVDVLSKIDNLILFKEYPAREKPWQGMSCFDLYCKIKSKNNNVKYFSSEKSLVKNLPINTAISFVGAGNICEIAKKIIKSYSKKG